MINLLSTSLATACDCCLSLLGQGEKVDQIFYRRLQNTSWSFRRYFLIEFRAPKSGSKPLATCNGRFR